MSARVLILGAGFGGLSSRRPSVGGVRRDVEVTVIDKSDAFVFGFSKLDVMFGRTTADAVHWHTARSSSRVCGAARDGQGDRSGGPTRHTDAGVHEAEPS